MGMSATESALADQFAQVRTGRARSERVGYYHRPRHWSQSLWVITDQTQPLLRVDKLGMGFIYLPQYGHAPPPERDRPPEHTYGAAHYGCEPDNSAELWTPILSHARGPSEFPADQVMYFRWYRPEMLPGVMNGRRIRFPIFDEKIRRAGGLKEYRCPDCTNITFFRPSHLARHLHNSHGYDQAAIIALGQASGIDFNEGLMSLVEAMSVWEAPETDQEQESSTTAPPDGIAVIETMVLPNQQQIRQAQEEVAQATAAVDSTTAMMIADLQQQIADLKDAMAIARRPKNGRVAKRPAKRVGAAATRGTGGELGRLIEALEEAEEPVLV